MYTAFASVYDRLMADVDYPAWAAFYRALLEGYGVRQGKVCECACGTGSLTIPLARMGYQMTGVDASADMLFEASQKARREGAMIPFVKQDMRALRLHRQMDAVLCTNDGLNYLPPGEDAARFFAAAHGVLRPGGVLALDVSTPYKLQHILGDSFLGDETEDIAYLWQNRYDPASASVEMNLAIFVRQASGQYLRIGEHQRQYAHTAEGLMAQLAEAGFGAVRLFGDRRMEEPGPQEHRWHLLAMKPFPVEEGAPPPATVEAPLPPVGEHATPPPQYVLK